MQHFDAVVRPGHLALVGLGPPLLLLALVHGADGVRGGGMAPAGTAALIACAELAPLGALAWMLCSVAAYSVEPGRVTVHRVLWDRTHALPVSAATVEEHRGVIRWQPGRRGCRVRPVDTTACLAALRQACGRTPPAATTPASRRG